MTTNHNGDIMSTLTTPTQIDLFRAKVILSAARLYLKTGMQVNRAYTPTAMRNAISEITGTAYPRSKQGLQKAHDELKALLDKITELLKD